MVHVCVSLHRFLRSQKSEVTSQKSEVRSRYNYCFHLSQAFAFPQILFLPLIFIVCFPSLLLLSSSSSSSSSSLFSLYPSLSLFTVHSFLFPFQSLLSCSLPPYYSLTLSNPWSTIVFMAKYENSNSLITFLTPHYNLITRSYKFLLNHNHKLHHPNYPKTRLNL